MHSLSCVFRLALDIKIDEGELSLHVDCAFAEFIEYSVKLSARCSVRYVSDEKAHFMV